MSITPDDQAEIVRSYGHYLASALNKPNTVKHRTADAVRFLRESPRPLAEIKTHHVQEFLANERWSLNTKATWRASLRSLFSWALIDGRITDDPTASLPEPRGTRTTASPASLEAIRQGLAAAGPRERLMIKLVWVLGLRTGEIATVHTSDLTREPSGDYVLRIRGRSKDLLSVPAGLAEELQTWSRRDYVFTGDINGHVSAPYVSRLVRKSMPNGETAGRILEAHKRRLESQTATLAWHDVAPFHSVGNLALEQHPEVQSSAAVRQTLDRISRGFENDPAGAVSASRGLLEWLFKAALADRGLDVPERDDLPGLYKAASKALNLTDDPRTDTAIAGLLRSLTSAVQSVAELRNSIGVDHVSLEQRAADLRQARLAFNSAVAVAEYIAAELWETPL